MKVARYNKSKYSASTSSSSSSAGGGGGSSVVPMPIDLTDIYNRLAVLEQKVAQINLDNYLSKTKNDETQYVLSAGTIVTNKVQGKQWNDGKGYRIFDETADGGQPTFNLKVTEQADSQTVAPFSGASEYYQWAGLEYNKPLIYTFSASTSVSALNITHADAQMTFFTEFICNDRRVTLQTMDVTYSVDGGTAESLTPDENGQCWMPMTTGTHDYEITMVCTVMVYLPSGTSIPSAVSVRIYGDDPQNNQTTVSWTDSVINKHTRITPSEATVLRNTTNGYSLRWDGLYKITGGVSTKLI